MDTTAPAAAAAAAGVAGSAVATSAANSAAAPAAAAAGSVRRRWAPRRLSSRIVGLFLLLLLLVQALAFGVISTSIERNARGQLASELEVGERIWHRLLDQKAQALVQGATLLAADYGFRSALASQDMNTLQSALQNNAERIGADVSAWLDTGLVVRAVSKAAGNAVDAGALRRVAAELTRSQQGSEVALVNGRPYQFVSVPVKAPLVIGWLVMGFPIDQALVNDMRALSGMQVVVFGQPAPGDSGAPLAAVASPAALVPRAAEVLVSTLPAAALQNTRADTGPNVLVAGAAMLTRRITLAPGASVMLLRSVDDAVGPFRQLQWLLLLISLGGVLVFAVGSVFTARHVTTPLRSLVRASVRLGEGDYAHALENTERPDEIGELAKAFDQMRVNIAAQAAEVRRLAYWDRLTGLPNRAQFRDAVQAAIDAGASSGHAPSATLAVVMLDLDRFKHVNDVLGYVFGDRLLKAVAERIVGQVVRTGDLVARLSGDEFALLLPGGDATLALAVAERVAKVFELPLLLEDQTVDISAGFGIACWPAHAGDADALLSRAEVAMYSAKHQRALALVYDPGIDAGSALTLSLLSELRRALEHDELRLFLQPKFALDSGRLIGAEALVRWQHPSRGMVPPMEFIPFAEQTGFVRQLTLWMFDATAREWPMMQALGIERVSVNLSTRDLMDQDLPAKLAEILARRHLSTRHFCLEITESAIMDDPQRAQATLNALSAAGFKLSIDDFGTGYSSLAYLKRLPVDELKIDKSFVLAMQTDAEDAKIVRSTIDLAHNLGLSVVAEGVENAAVWHQLRALDCDEAQGYHMSRPLPAAELSTFATRWRDKATLSASVALH